MVCRYRNLGGNSGVRTYEITVESIAVGFHDGSVYDYTYQSAGAHNIEHMKVLAERGRGLSAFINERVKFRYATKRRAFADSL